MLYLIILYKKEKIKIKKIIDKLIKKNQRKIIKKIYYFYFKK